MLKRVDVGWEGTAVAAMTLPAALDDKVGLVVVPNPSTRPVKPAPYPNSSVVGGFAADEGPAGTVLNAPNELLRVCP